MVFPAKGRWRDGLRAVRNARSRRSTTLRRAGGAGNTTDLGTEYPYRNPDRKKYQSFQLEKRNASRDACGTMKEAAPRFDKCVGTRGSRGVRLVLCKA